jgi:hypothetical protein
MLREPATPRVRRSPSRALFAIVLLLSAYFIPRGIQANADSHLALTYAIVEHQTVRIDRYAPHLIDKAVYCSGASGGCHYYIDKAPGISLLASIVYAPLRYLLPSSIIPANPQDDRFLLRYILTLLVVSVLCAAFAVAFWRFLSTLVDRRWAMLATIGYALGSMALPFSMLLFSHALTAALLFFAFIVLFNHDRSPRPSNRLPLAAGVIAGVAIGCEYPTAIIAALLFGYLVITASRRMIGVQSSAAFVTGVLVGLAPVMAYNLLVFGTPLGQGYAHLTDPYYSAGMAHGILGVSLPTWSAIWGTTFSPFRGLFVLSPWLLLAGPGLCVMFRRGLLWESLLCLAIAVFYFMFQAGYAFWDGGASVGPRHFLPALPFLVFPVTFSFEIKALRSIGLILISYSVALMALVVATNPLFGDPHYVANAGNPIIDQTLHDVSSGVWQNNWGMVFGLHGVAALVPLAALAAYFGRKLLQFLDGAETAEPVADL